MIQPKAQGGDTQIVSAAAGTEARVQKECSSERRPTKGALSSVPTGVTR